jgi:hypothetical protein
MFNTEKGNTTIYGLNISLSLNRKCGKKKDDYRNKK